MAEESRHDHNIVCGCCEATPKEDERFLVCSRCRHLSYCTKECQKSDWSIHKATCSTKFELFDSKCGGKGLRACTSIKAGEEIMRESAVMKVTTKQAATSQAEAEAMHARAVQVAYDALNPTKQRAFMNLSVCDQWREDIPGDDEHSSKTPVGVFQTNSYQLKGEDMGGVFSGMARLNHSCRPNVNHTWRPDLQQTLVLATRDIAADEELFTTYGPSECMDTDGRRDFLQSNFSFLCGCDMCAEGNSLGGDDRMTSLRELHASLPGLVGQGFHQKAIDNVDECIELLAAQGIGSGVFTKPLFEYGYQIARMGLKDRKLAKSYLGRQIQAVTECEGVKCPEQLRLTRLRASF